MNTRDSERARRVLAAGWLKASNSLGFRFEPGATARWSGGDLTLVGFLPDFGSKHGMILGFYRRGGVWGPGGLAECAAENGWYHSWVSMDIYGSEASLDVFCEALRDWGYFGPEDGRPGWC